MKKPKRVWAIAYIDRNFLPQLPEELKHYGYTDIKCYVPTVRLLKKQFKGKDQFEFVPLLLNYGFFKIPYEKACDSEWLSELRQRIGAIYGWVKDPTKNLSEKVILRADNSGMTKGMPGDNLEDDQNMAELYRNLPQCALAKTKEVLALKKSADVLSVFSDEDIDRISIGDYITLKGYPFDNVPAEVLEINKKKQHVKVRLDISSNLDVVTVSFENVFYTIYSSQDPDDPMRETSLDEIESYRTTDGILFNLDLNEID